MNFLLAEDFEFNAILVKEKLKTIGDTCTAVANGQEAIEILKTRTDFDAILMDLEMPILDGREAAVIIRTQLPPPASKIPIIAITGYEMEEVENELKKYGFDFILVKPFDLDKMQEIKLKIIK